MKKNLKMFLLIVVCILILVLFYFVLKNKQKEDKKESIVNFAEGITVIENNQEKIVKDEKEKIELKMEDNWDLIRPENILEIIVKEDKYYGEAQKSFFILKGDLFEDNFEDEINRWLNLQNSICPDCYIIEDYIFLNNLQTAIIRDQIAINDQKDFLFIKNNYLYGISTTNVSLEEVEEIIKNIKFLK